MEAPHQLLTLCHLAKRSEKRALWTTLKGEAVEESVPMLPSRKERTRKRLPIKPVLILKAPRLRNLLLKRPWGVFPRTLPAKQSQRFIARTMMISKKHGVTPRARLLLMRCSSRVPSC